MGCVTPKVVQQYDTAQPMNIMPTPSQQDYQYHLQQMQEENYGRFRPDDLKRMLRAYFYFLEREITGHEETSYADANFSTTELVNMIAEMEPELKKTKLLKLRAMELLSKLSEPALSPDANMMNMTRITAVVCDITRQSDCDAIVNAANTRLKRGGVFVVPSTALLARSWSSTPTNWSRFG